MPPVGRYVRNEDKYKVDAYAVLRSHFGNRRKFEEFYAAILENRRNEFLRVCATYRYLAKHGDWKIRVRGFNPVIGYLTNSYKLVAIFSIIESLSDLDHLDFYQWLTARSRKGIFPIQDRKTLDALYREYKSSYGATRRCIKFFSRLPIEEQRNLCGSITVEKKPTTEIKRLAEFLYNLRSGFVHKAEFAHEIGGPALVVTRQGLVRSTMTVDSIFHAFEVGVIEHFRSDA